MKLLNSNRMRLVVVGVVAVMVFGGKSAKADFNFGTITALEATINDGIKWFDCISYDGLELYIEKPNGGVQSTDWDIYVSTRSTTWSIPVKLESPVNSSYMEGYACLSSDDLELYFTSDRPGGYGSSDLWITTRPTRFDPWGPPENLGPTINTSGYDEAPWITPDGLELYFSSDRPGSYGYNDIWVAKRPTKEDDWVSPVNLGPVVNSTAFDGYPCLAPGGLVLFFSEFPFAAPGPPGAYRPGGLGWSDMWMTRRKSIMDPWEPPVNLGSPLNGDGFEYQPRISPDGSVLYFSALRSGGKLNNSGFNVFQTPIIPIVDFNGDGFVDADDMCIMVDYWGTDNKLCDIGPMPWGDGIVDVEDLIVLTNHLFNDYNAIAHWKLDETTGNIAHDYVGWYNATLHGEPTWQPRGGQIVGALEFDGTDDYIRTDYILNPSQRAFSVLVWVKGGMPGQAIISQSDGTGTGNTWLGLDTQGGTLMTGLVPPSTGWTAKKPLVSEFIINDEKWHHIGFVWDGSYRILYVDGIEVAKDTDAQNPLKPADGGLHIGAGKTLAAGTFFSGLIDDIRIYNRVVSP